MVVNTTNLYSESRNVLKTLIDANVIDPKIGSVNSRRRWIYRELPDTTSRDFQGYPIIVVLSPDASDNVQDLQDSLSDGRLSFAIEVYAEYNDVDARVDDLSSQIYGLFRKKANTESLAQNNLFRPRVTSSPFSNTDTDNKKLSGRVFIVEFDTTLEEDVYGNV